MDKVMLQVNDIFSQAWKGCQKPMWFRILNIDRITNSIEVECHSFDGLNVFPEVWSLDSTEAGFEIPVGATVYINYAHREVVSTDIKYLGLLEE